MSREYDSPEFSLTECPHCLAIVSVKIREDNTIDYRNHSCDGMLQAKVDMEHKNPNGSREKRPPKGRN